MFPVYLKEWLIMFHFVCYQFYFWSWGNSVSIAMDYGWTARVQFLARARKYSLLYRIQTGCGVYPAFYPMGTRGKAARA
jgi:hypothetical protein